MRFFNTAGPVIEQKHYCMPPLERINIDEILLLIEQWKYFIMHAPRQTGKTSTLLALMEHLNKSGEYKVLYINVENAQTTRENVETGIESIVRNLAEAEKYYLKESNISSFFEEELRLSPHTALGSVLHRWAMSSDKPTILLVDEIDSLVGDTLIAVLRQLRSNYAKRPNGFPQSIILCGVRDVKDYRIVSSKEKEVITGGSCFNIKSESLKLGSFTLDEVKRILIQHTQETKQIFTENAVELIFKYSNGQPWLVNALAYYCCFKNSLGKIRTNSITEEMVNESKEKLIYDRVTHLDQLTDKLKEDRVRGVIAPMIEGKTLIETNPDNIQYCIDLGLIERTKNGLQISNPIYREVIPRELTWITQMNMESTINRLWYINEDGSISVEKLLIDFQKFFRENSESWIERFEYKEAGPQLLLQAYLQRVINGGGRIEREYGLGRMRTDLLLIWPYEKGEQRVVFELKIQHKGRENTIAKGLEQTSEYLDRVGQKHGHLLIFDRDENVSWDDKIYREEHDYNGFKIEVWGM